MCGSNKMLQLMVQKTLCSLFDDPSLLPMPLQPPYTDVDDPSIVALRSCLQISLDCILEHGIFLMSLLAVLQSVKSEQQSVERVM